MKQDLHAITLYLAAINARKTHGFAAPMLSISGDDSYSLDQSFSGPVVIHVERGKAPHNAVSSRHAYLKQTIHDSKNQMESFRATAKSYREAEVLHLADSADEQADLLEVKVAELEAEFEGLGEVPEVKQEKLTFPEDPEKWFAKFKNELKAIGKQELLKEQEEAKKKPEEPKKEEKSEGK